MNESLSNTYSIFFISMGLQEQMKICTTICQCCISETSK